MPIFIRVINISKNGHDEIQWTELYEFIYQRSIILTFYRRYIIYKFSVLYISIVLYSLCCIFLYHTWINFTLKIVIPQFHIFSMENPKV